MGCPACGAALDSSKFLFRIFPWKFTEKQLKTAQRAYDGISDLPVHPTCFPGLTNPISPQEPYLILLLHPFSFPLYLFFPYILECPSSTHSSETCSPSMKFCRITVISLPLISHVKPALVTAIAHCHIIHLWCRACLSELLNNTDCVCYIFVPPHISKIAFPEKQKQQQHPLTFNRYSYI